MNYLICINKKRLTQGIGYGLWGLITVGIIIMLLATNYEMTTLYEKDNGTGWKSDNEMCYDSVFDGETCIQMLDYIYGTPKLWKVNAIMWIMLIIDVVIIGIWIYQKQTKVKFGLCDKTTIKKKDESCD